MIDTRTSAPPISEQEKAVARQARAEWPTLSTEQHMAHDNDERGYVALRCWNSIEAIRTEFHTGGLSSYMAMWKSVNLSVLD